MPAVLAAEYQARTKAIGTATGMMLGAQWDRPGLWADRVTVAAGLVAVGQQRAASLAEPYLAVAGGADVRIVPESFAGVASDGRPLDSLMLGAAFAADSATIARDATEAERQAAMRSAAKSWLWLAAMTQVADAARASLRAGMAVRDVSGVRVASRPCCGRCAVLNGRVYHWRANFLRHPRCDCTYEVSRDAAVAPVPLDQIRGLSQADRWAVENGADLNQVVNAHRGMYTVEQGGRKVKATKDSTVHLDASYPSRTTYGPRLRPEAILASADDSEEAIGLLSAYGYIR